jgi:predicted RNA binding protein YcfA (HicA-like mRNA interferase family)
MQMGRQKIRIPNPHSSQEIGMGLLTEILRQAGIEESVWEKL